MSGARSRAAKDGPLKQSMLRSLMMLMLFLLSLGVGALALLCFGLSLISYNDGFHRIDADQRQFLDEASAFVERAHAASGTMPTMSEFSRWSKGIDPRRGSKYDDLEYLNQREHFDDALISCFGQPPHDGYALSFWYHDLNLTVASWQADRNRACIDDDAVNYSYGKRFPLHLLFFIAGILIAALAFGIYKLCLRC